MMVTCDYNDIVPYHRRRPGLSNAPLNRKYDNHDIKRQPSKEHTYLMDTLWPYLLAGTSSPEGGTRAAASTHCQRQPPAPSACTSFSYAYAAPDPPDVPWAPIAADRPSSCSRYMFICLKGVVISMVVIFC